MACLYAFHLFPYMHPPTIKRRLYSTIERNCFSSPLMSTDSHLAIVSPNPYRPLLLENRPFDHVDGGAIVMDATVRRSPLSSDFALLWRSQVARCSDSSGDMTLCRLPCFVAIPRTFQRKSFIMANFVASLRVLFLPLYVDGVLINAGVFLVRLLVSVNLLRI